MKQYLKLLQDIMDNGVDHNDRTGVGTRRVFCRQLRFDLSKGFPAMTTKKLAWNPMAAELIWFLRGSTNVNDLRAIQHGEENRFNLEKKTVWDDNYNKQAVDLGYSGGELGPVYGKQWRSFRGQRFTDIDSSIGRYWEIHKVDQIKEAINQIQNNSESRRIIVSAWNPTQIQDMALPPCHMEFQFLVMQGRLNCRVTMRSVDCFLGLPFNIASYALLTHIISGICELEVGDLVMQLTDTHIYRNHFDQVQEQMSRDLSRPIPQLAGVVLLDLDQIMTATPDMWWLENYNPHGSIKAEMAI